MGDRRVKTSCEMPKQQGFHKQQQEQQQRQERAVSIPASGFNPTPSHKAPTSAASLATPITGFSDLSANAAAFVPRSVVLLQKSNEKRNCNGEQRPKGGNVPNDGKHRSKGKTSSDGEGSRNKMDGKNKKNWQQQQQLQISDDHGMIGNAQQTGAKFTTDTYAIIQQTKQQANKENAKNEKSIEHTNVCPQKQGKEGGWKATRQGGKEQGASNGRYKGKARVDDADANSNDNVAGGQKKLKGGFKPAKSQNIHNPEMSKQNHIEDKPSTKQDNDAKGNNEGNGGPKPENKQIQKLQDATDKEKLEPYSHHIEDKPSAKQDNDTRCNKKGKGGSKVGNLHQNSQHFNDQEKSKPQHNIEDNPFAKQVSPKGDRKEKRLRTKAERATDDAIPPNRPQTTNDLNYGAGRPVIVVHVAEKPSIAQAIAQGLGGGSASSHGRSLPVYELSGPSFPKSPRASRTNHRVTSVAGHIFSVDFPPEYQLWDSVDPAELFHAPVIKKPCKGSVVRHLQEVAKGADFIVLWMDCDREGENINFEVLDCCLHLICGENPYDRVYRAYFSAINTLDIQKAYNSLGKPNRAQSLSVDARQELDLKVGVAFSRFQTRFFQGRYGDLDSTVLSYGPCQTPTLGFCVARHIEIEMFKPKPYWTLDLGVMNSGKMVRALWDTGRSFNKNKVDGLVAKCRDASPPASVRVVYVTAKDKKQGRPVPLNTVALLKACSKALSIGPHQALNVAERLYLSGYLSYPRTESTKYPESFDIEGTLRDQAQDNRWGFYVSKLLKGGINFVKGGVDMGDHPPITPCRHAHAGELRGNMARVYDLVVRHFIASVSHDAVWRCTTVHLSMEALGDDKGSFTIRGKELTSAGFLEIMLYKQHGDEGDEGCGSDIDEHEEKHLPKFREGDEYEMFLSSSKMEKVSLTPVNSKFCTLDVKERITTPPTHLTESELIGRMEKNGIGTDASISTHVENILKRNYVELISGRKLRPTRLGLVLAQGYHLIDDSLVLPRVRSDIEGQCNKIANGLADRAGVVRKAIELFSAKFNYFVENINKMDVLFGSSFAILQDIGKPFTRCGLTRRYLQFITGPPPRLYNKTTESVYPLPIGGEVKQWTGRYCPVEGCGFELCLYSVGTPARSFPLCPNCYNNPRSEFDLQPGEDTAAAAKLGREEDETKERSMRNMAGKNMVRECPHPDNHPLIEQMTVSPDPESDGVLILDPHLGPKWRLISTREPTIVHLPKCVDRVTILNEKDEVLDCHMMLIEFREGQSPIDGKQAKYTSCFASDEVMQGLVRVHHGDERLKASRGRVRGRRGRGQGGGRGGRGRCRRGGR